MVVQVARKAPSGYTPLPLLLLILSITTGLIDAVSVLGLGKVFVANMTGNVVFIGFAAGGATGFAPLPLAMALASFLAGALVAGRTANHQRGHPMRHWLVRAAMTEAGLIWGGAALAFLGDGTAPGPATIMAIIGLLGFAMGFRNATVRRLGIADLTTTVLTLTLAGLASDSALAGGSNPNFVRRCLAVVAVFVGAAAGAVLIRFTGGICWPLVAAGAIILGSTLAFANHGDVGLPAA